VVESPWRSRSSGVESGALVVTVSASHGARRPGVFDLARWGALWGRGEDGWIKKKRSGEGGGRSGRRTRYNYYTIWEPTSVLS
jgi:hypothetical protein